MDSHLSSCSKGSCHENIEYLSNALTVDCSPLGVTLPKVETVVIEDIPQNNDMKDAPALALTCPKGACIPGLSSVVEPAQRDHGFSSVNVLSSCPGGSVMAGFPSRQNTETKDLNTIHEILCEKQIKNEPLSLLQNNKNNKMEKAVSRIKLSKRITDLWFSL